MDEAISSCSDSDSGDESYTDLEVVLDEDCRIFGSRPLCLQYEFTSCNHSAFIDKESNALNPVSIIDVLKNDVDSIFDGCTTFWMPGRGFEPRTTFERLALKIFTHHMRNVPSEEMGEIDWRRTGAEYWTQRRELAAPCGQASLSSAASGEMQSHTLVNDDSMIRFHWDKDEDLVDQTDGRITVHPQVSTVTYLTDGGSPTIIIPHRYSMEPTEENESPTTEPVHTERPKDSFYKEIFSSYPKLGKHVSFDGRFLHGSPGALSVSLPIAGAVRMTFLVNIWVNWKPLGADLFPDEHLSMLSNIPGDIFDFNCAHTDQDISYDTIDTSASTDLAASLSMYRAYYGPNAWDNTVSFKSVNPIAMTDMIVNSGCSSFCLRDAGHAATVVATPRQTLSTVPELIYSPAMTIGHIMDVFNQSQIVLVKCGAVIMARELSSSAVSSQKSFVSKLTKLQACHPNIGDFCSCRVNKKKCHIKDFLKFMPAKESYKAKKARHEEDSGSSSTEIKAWSVAIETETVASGIVDEIFLTDITDSFQLSYASMLGHPLPPLQQVAIYSGVASSAVKRKPTPPDEERSSQATSIITSYMQICGCCEWAATPDVSQNWPLPPPVINDIEGRPQEFLSFHVEVNDMLLINRGLWAYEVSPSDGCCSSSGKRLRDNVGNLCLGVALGYDIDRMSGIQVPLNS